MCGHSGLVNQVGRRTAKTHRTGPPDTPAALFDISDRGHVAGVHCDVGLAGPCTSWTTFRWHDGTLTQLDVDGYRGLGSGP